MPQTHWPSQWHTSSVPPCEGKLSDYQAQARASNSGTWYDGIGRVVETANFGTNSYSSTPPALTITTALVTQYEYAYSDTNSDGTLETITKTKTPTTDADTRVDWTIYDAAGRTIKTVQNYKDDNLATDTDSADGLYDEDITTLYGYNAAGQLATLTVLNPSTTDQVTTYVYGSDLGLGSSALVHRNDLLRAVIYPDSDDTASLGDGGDGVYDRVEYRYNRRGQQTQVKDQNQTVHDYVFDALGRQTQDRVTAFGAGVDNAVKRIERTYEVRGMVAHTTSYDNATVGLGNVLNDVLDEYDAWGLLVKESQSHSGPVSGSTPHVDYAHADAAHGLRPTSVTYPGGRQIDYLYDDDANPATVNANDAMNRLYAIKDDATGQIQASYKYLGLGTIVVEDYESADVKLDLWGGTSGTYQGFDQFGRIVDQKWIDYNATPTVIDEYTYQYDLAGNRTSKVNTLQTGFNESYTYDDVSRLISTVRADSFDQSWTLDATGNFSTFNDDGYSTTRTVNEANQIQSISGNWVDPKYDAAGNMISGPKTAEEDVRLHRVYDAWNRQVAVYRDDGDGVFEPGAGDTFVAEYEYDGANRRIEKTLADGSGREYFYNSQWQLVEERFVNGVGEATAVNGYVWSPRYIDAPVVRFHDGNADGDLLDGVDNTRHYTGDANHNVTSMLDAATGAVVERYVYTSYGGPMVLDANWAGPGGPPTADGIMYAGYFFDAETADLLARHRYYNVALATWITTDPIAADKNLYRYVGNNPVINTDPAGLFMWALYDVPPSWWKCAIVAEALGMGSSVDSELVGNWIAGHGSTITWNSVGMNAFDTDGTMRQGVLDWMKNRKDIYDGLTCGTTKSGVSSLSPNTSDLNKRNAISSNKMINRYWFSYDCHWSVTKNCNANGCCTGISVSVTCNFRAYDHIEFSTNAPYLNAQGEWEHAFSNDLGVYISDRLVAACYPCGKSFDVVANSSNTMSWTQPCQ